MISIRLLAGEATRVKPGILQSYRHWAQRAWLTGVASVGFLLCSGTGSFAQDVLTRARQALENGHIQDAIALLESYRGSHEKDPNTYNLLGIAYGRAGDENRSLAMFEEFARLAPNKSEAYNNLGATYLHMQNGEQAAAAFRHALRFNPRDANALYNLGALLNAEQKFSESRPFLERAFRLDHSAAVAYETAVALAGSGDRKTALNVLNSVTPPTGVGAVPWLTLIGKLNLDEGNLASASKALQNAIALAPEDRESLYALALVRLKQKQADDAVPLLDKAFGSLLPSTREVREGAVLASYGAYSQSDAALERAVSEDPGSYEAWYNLAVLRIEQFKDSDGAMEAAEHALALKPTGEIQNVLGDVCEAKAHYPDALNHYQEAVRLDPSNDKFAFDLGAELLLHENYDAALIVYRAAVAKFPNAARIHLGLGTAEFMRGKTDESVSDFLKAADLAPAFEPGYMFLGEAFSASETHSKEVVAKLAYVAGRRRQSFDAQYYYGAALVKEMDYSGDLQNADLALAALRRAQALRPGDARVYYQLGELFRVRKQVSQAVPYYQKSAALDANFPEPLYKLGQAYVRLGKQEEAKQTFARHREIAAKTEASLTRRFGEIQSFVLKMREAQ